MGRLTVTDMLDHTPPKLALGYHMTANLYPPPPPYMVDVASDAILAFHEDDPDRLIELPEGTLYRGSAFASASAIVEAFRLDVFVERGDEA